MEPISYFNAVLADPHITMVQILHMQRPVEVAWLYVPLHLSEIRQQGFDASVSEEVSTEATGVEEVQASISIEEERQRRERNPEVIYDPEKAIHTFQRCVVIGDSGAGKTMLLRYLTIMAAQRSSVGISAPLALYVELPFFASSGLHDLLDFVCATWEKAYAFSEAELLGFLSNYLDEGKVWLLLDALDEAIVGETPEAAAQSYEAISEAILTFAARYPNVSIAVTMRKASYRQHRPLVGFTALEVMNFRVEDAKQFVRNWYDAASDGMTNAIDEIPAQKSADLIKHLDTHPSLQTMAANPLLLTLIALIYEDCWSLPEHRAELYRRCIEAVLMRWDSGHGIPGRWEFEPEQKHQLLKVIAWHFHRKRQRFFTEADLLQVIAGFLPAIHLPAERNRDILQAIENEQGALSEQTTGWYGFLHVSLQEYLAAEYINDHQAYAELYQHRADARWEEVLLFYMGITPDADLFLQQFCSQNSALREDIFYTNMLLAGRCLTAHPTMTETGLQTQVIERLFELVLSTPYSFLRQEAMRVLCGIGGFETNRKLAALLSGERLNVFVRWTIAEALGKLGERSVAGELMGLLSIERLDTELRRGIAEALGGLGERAVASDLARLLSDERLDTELRKDIAGALGRLGERSVAGELVGLLADEHLHVSLRCNIAHTLGKLGEQSIVEDLVGLLADEWLDVDLRRSIADALGTLGEWSVVAHTMVELLADDQQDMFVRRRITGALGTLAEVSGSLADESERSVAKELAQLLADEWLDADLRKSIADVLGMLGERTVVRNLVELLLDDQQDVNVRRGIAEALGRLGERSVAAQAMVPLLSDERYDSFVRRSIVETLARLGDRSVTRDLVRLLSDERLDADLQWSIANALGRLGERAVTGELTKLLADGRLDVNVRRSIAIALGALGERTVAAQAMMQWLAGDQFGVFAQRSIADTLGKLGERSIAGELVQLLADEQRHLVVRCSIAEALGRLGEHSVAGELTRLLADKGLDASLRRSIARALETCANDIAIIEGLIQSLPDKEISNSVYSALWAMSRRMGIWIFPAHLRARSTDGEQPQVQYELVQWRQEV